MTTPERRGWTLMRKPWFVRVLKPSHRCRFGWNHGHRVWRVSFGWLIVTVNG